MGAFCTRCGRALTDEDEFCPGCSATTQFQKIKADFCCPNCGAGLRESYLFCPSCGTRSLFGIPGDGPVGEAVGLLGCFSVLAGGAIAITVVGLVYHGVHLT